MINKKLWTCEKALDKLSQLIGEKRKGGRIAVRVSLCLSKARSRRVDHRNQGRIKRVESFWKRKLLVRIITSSWFLMNLAEGNGWHGVKGLQRWWINKGVGTVVLLGRSMPPNKISWPIIFTLVSL